MSEQRHEDGMTNYPNHVTNSAASYDEPEVEITITWDSTNGAFVLRAVATDPDFTTNTGRIIRRQAEDLVRRLTYTVQNGEGKVTV